MHEPQRDKPLAGLTTLELGGSADHYVCATTDAEVLDAVAWADANAHPLTVLGGGSNSIVPDDGVRGLVLHMGTMGREVRTEGDTVWLRVAAGEPWPALVDWTVAQGWAGLECLAGIPGQVGATPIQNVGAYGQDVAETIVRVGCLDRSTKQRVELEAPDCGFQYRDSWFKQNPRRYVVLDVDFELRRGGPPSRRYAELVKATSEDATLQEVRDAVVGLRRRKSMVLDPEDPNRRSAGSFFTNPIVDPQVAEAVVEKARALGCGDVPQWVHGSQVKLAAGWLIEKAGFPRGTRAGAIGSSSKHGLALVHHGGGTTAELLAFARSVQDAVFEAFAVTLEREPRLLGQL